MKNKYYPTLFSPIQVGNMTLPNRVAMVPTDISSANADGSVNQRVITYHEEVAKGAVGSSSSAPRRPTK